MTPTGALLVTGYATAFGPMPAMRVERVGYGAGARDFADTPNVLRVLIGEAESGRAGATACVVIEAEIDDMNPQIFGVLMERLLAAGRARRLLHADPDEEEPARDAADGHRAAGRARAPVGRRSSARRRRSACATARWTRECLIA